MDASVERLVVVELVGFGLRSAEDRPTTSQYVSFQLRVVFLSLLCALTESILELRKSDLSCGLILDLREDEVDIGSGTCFVNNPAVFGKLGENLTINVFFALAEILENSFQAICGCGFLDHGCCLGLRSLLLLNDDSGYLVFLLWC